MEISSRRKSLMIILTALSAFLFASLIDTENRRVVLTVVSSQASKHGFGFPISFDNSTSVSVTLSLSYDKTNDVNSPTIEKIQNQSTFVKSKSTFRGSFNQSYNLIEESQNLVATSARSKIGSKTEIESTAFSIKEDKSKRKMHSNVTLHFKQESNQYAHQSVTNHSNRLNNKSIPVSKVEIKTGNDSLILLKVAGNVGTLEAKSIPTNSTKVLNNFSKGLPSKTSIENKSSNAQHKPKSLHDKKKPRLRRRKEESQPQKQSTFPRKQNRLSPDISSIRLSTKSLKYIAFNATLSSSQKAQIFPISNPQDSSTVALYNSEALEKLKEIKKKIKLGKNITLVMNGGSSSAFVPNGTPEDRFYLQFIHGYLESELNATVNVIDRAHGSRNSAHSAHLMTSFLPQNAVDIVLWEFSINDGSRREDVRNSFILWLRNLASLYKSPPLVILIYLWKSPFTVNNYGRVYCRTFEQHAMIGAEYDFVLGHINMASYFDSLRWNTQELKSAFLADAHHPNALTHHIIAKLLAQLFSKAEDSFTPILAGVPRKKTELEWACGINTRDKRKLKSLFMATKGIARGSFTVDLPRNSEGTHPSMLIPQSNSTLNYISFGKINSQRSDRQNGLVIPCCKKQSTVEFNLEKFNNLKAIMVSLRCSKTRKESLRVIKNGKLLDLKPNFIRPWNWRCLLGGYNMNIGELPSLDVDFLILESGVDRIGFCDSKCDLTNPIPLVYLSAF